jgi:hypothetical protein
VTTSQPAGPRPVQRRDGTTAWSSGLLHTGFIRTADLLRSLQKAPKSASTSQAEGTTP